MESKECARCKNIKPIYEFLNGTVVLKNCSTCRDRMYRYHRMRRAVNVNETKNCNLKRNYGITIDDYNALRLEQDYRCAICGMLESEIPQKRVGRPRKDGLFVEPESRLVVDHCHESGKVRGLLCPKCNHGIGSTGITIEWFANAISYLERHGNVA